MKITNRKDRSVARFGKELVFATALAVALLFIPGLATSDEDHSHGGAPTHHPGLHFSHPLISESPSPDTKVRLDYFFQHVDSNDEKADESTLRLELEYAFHRAFSFSIQGTYAFLDQEDESNETDFGDTELAFKFANFAFEKHNVLLGYGVGFGFPTGNDSKGIGSNNIFEISPFLNMGYKRSRLEVVAFTKFTIPTNQGGDEEVETEFEYNLSFLYHFTSRITVLLEFDGETVLSGDDHGRTVLNITPGIKIRPLRTSETFEVGVGISFPLTNDEEFDARGVLSFFYHL